MYKIIDTQGGGIMRDDVFKTKQEVIDRLAGFHNSDFHCEECEDIYDHLNKQAFDTEEQTLDWLLEWGQWELESF